MSYHVSVMREETIDALNVKKDGLYLDATLGGGGHTQAILDRGGRVVGIDRDDDALTHCKNTLVGDVTYIKGQYENAVELLKSVGISSLSGAVMDLGVSSHQLDDGERGFSYMHGGPLDMRMDRTQELSAYDVVNEYDEKELADILWQYGEERFSRRIAAAIIKRRTQKPIESTSELADIIANSVPHRVGAHPAKKSFQAIRIEVNGELRDLRKAIDGIFGLIEKGGRLSIITFHSLEDRIVKTAFTDYATACICPKSLPICVCNHKATGKIIGRYKSTDSELNDNPRAKSATLRVIEKL